MAQHWLQYEPTWPPVPFDGSMAIANLLGHWWFGSQRTPAPYDRTHHLDQMESQLVQQVLKGKDLETVGMVMPLWAYLRARFTPVDSSTGQVYQPRTLFGPPKPGRDPWPVDLFLLERVELILQGARQCPQHRRCLGAYLAVDTGVRRLGRAALAQVEEVWLDVAEEVERGANLSWTPLYFTPLLRRIGRPFGRDLAALLADYDASRTADEVLLDRQQLGGKSDDL